MKISVVYCYFDLLHLKIIFVIECVPITAFSKEISHVLYRVVFGLIFKCMLQAWVWFSIQLYPYLI